MPTRKALILTAPQTIKFQEETLPELKPQQVLIRSVLSAFKHGTEMEAYFGSSPFLNKTLDFKWRIFQENEPGTSSILYPETLGNMTVGIVEAVGSEVTDIKEGEQVFGWLPVADWHVCEADKVFPLGGMTPEYALSIDPANFALGGLLDGQVSYPDKVLVTGLGAIGLLAVQYCKLAGATVYASSSFEVRRKLATQYGADMVLNRRDFQDMALEIKKMTNGGVDVVLECSGHYAQLQMAMRAVRQCGRVVGVGFYSGDASVLNLGEEFFHNRLTLLASLPDAYWQNPVRTDPPIYAAGVKQLIIDDLRANRLNPEGLLYPIYPFEQAEDAIDAIANRPQDTIKVGIRY